MSATFCPFLISSILGGSLLLWKEIFEKISSSWVQSHSYPQSEEMCLRRAEPTGSKDHIYPPNSSESNSWICPLFSVPTAMSLDQAGLVT